MNFNFAQTAFIAVDIQNDFCPGGSLAVEDGDKIVPIVNKLSKLFAKNDSICVATQDWHPVSHCSFESSGHKDGMWPDHCVQCTPGADFRPNLKMNPYRMIIRKGFHSEIDSYSAFFENDHKTETGLHHFLSGLKINTVVITGLALDYCVYFSAVDAAKLGYNVFVVTDACGAVNSPENSAQKALDSMVENKITLIKSSEILE